MFFALCLITILSIQETALSQGASLSREAEVRFLHLTNEQGLSQNFVNAIVQDRTGLIWFGTQDGLDAFDGYSFRHFRHSDADPHTLSDDFVNTLYCDNAGILWVGTMSGLNRFDSSRGEFVRFLREDTGTNHLAGDVVTSLCGGPDGSLWVGTIGGLQRLRPGAQSFESVAIQEHQNAGSIDSISVVAPDRTGLIWVGTWNGVVLLDTAGRIVDRYAHSVLQGNLSHNEVLSILQDGAGQIWVGTRNGINLFDRTTNAFHRIPFASTATKSGEATGEYISSIAQDHAGSIWIGTQAGLWSYNTATREWMLYQHDPVIPGSLADDHVRCSFEDRGGTLWFGTSRGADRYHASVHKLAHFRHEPSRQSSLKNDQVWAIGGDGRNSVWISTSQGLDRFDRTTGIFDHAVESGTSPVSLSRDVILSIANDAEGRTWFGSSTGILSAWAPGQSVKHFPLRDLSGAVVPLPIFSIAAIAPNRLVLGTFKGIAVFDVARGSFVEDSGLPFKELTDDNVLVSLFDSHKRLWVGTMKGLMCWSFADNSVRRYTHRGGDTIGTLSHDRVYALLESRSGEIWAGTHEGLNRFESASHEFTRFGIKQGLSSPLIYGALEDRSGGIWVSTNRGISRLDTLTKTFRNYDRSDGAQDQEFNQFSSYCAPDGEMFFGGGNGFNAFNPESLKINTHVPNVIISSLRTGKGESRAPFFESSLQLPWNDHSFFCEIASLDFAQPGKNRYAYMLEGFDHAWIESGTQRFMSYTNLDPGEYTLRIRGSNNDAVWNESGLALHIIVAAPFWQTLWFRFIVVVLLVGMVILVIKLRTRAMRRRNRALEARIKERTAELSKTVVSLEEQMNARQIAEQKTLEYQGELQNLAAELSLTEERERRRMAALLHDDIGQSLAFCRNKLDMMESQGGTTEEQLEMLRADLEKIITKTRSLTFDLSPPVLYELGLTEAIEWLLEKFGKEHAVEFRLSNGERSIPIPDAWRYTLFLAVRELIINAIKHAGATRIDVRVKRENGTLILGVKDNGAGFDPAVVKPRSGEHGGFGLFNVRERLKQCNGRIEVVSRPGEGTTITITVPL